MFALPVSAKLERGLYLYVMDVYQTFIEYRSVGYS